MENEVVEFESNFTSFDFTHNAHQASGSLIHKFSGHTQTYYIYSFFNRFVMFQYYLSKIVQLYNNIAVLSYL